MLSPTRIAVTVSAIGALAVLNACGDTPSTPAGGGEGPGPAIDARTDEPMSAPVENTAEDRPATAPVDPAAPGVGRAVGDLLDGPLELTWEELMPEGEEERLVKLYEDFYAQLEFDLNAMPEMSLADAGVAGIEEGSAADVMPQIGTFNTVAELDGTQVRMPGFVVPLSSEDGKTHAEFLLVPYFGACLHSPPPPPNQIVYVTADPAVEHDDIWAAVWVEGEMSTKANKHATGDAAYTLALSNLELYEW